MYICILYWLSSSGKLAVSSVSVVQSWLWNCFWNSFCFMAGIHFQWHGDWDQPDTCCELCCLLHSMYPSNLACLKSFVCILFVLGWGTLSAIYYLNLIEMDIGSNSTPKVSTWEEDSTRPYMEIASHSFNQCVT